MAKKIVLTVSVLALAGLLCLPLSNALAAHGAPGSSEFGYGTALHLDGPYVVESVRIAADLQLDWLSVDISWQALQPNKGKPVNWAALEPFLAEAGRTPLAILASLTQAPAWAMTPSGPDAGLTAQFAVQLSQKLGSSLQALELFPGANTSAAWGAIPDAKAYLNVCKAVQAALQSAKLPMILVGAGLVPAGAQPQAGSVDDLVFLQSLYQAGAKNVLPVISIRLAEVTGSPMTAASPAEHRVLRHYEEVREVMLKNGHDRGQVWVTQMQPPDGSLSEDDSAYQTPDQQAAWLSQALGQLRAQLYLGVAFLDAINPPARDAGQTFSLVTASGEFHPAYRILRDLIVQNNSGSADARPGRAKTAPLGRNK